MKRIQADLGVHRPCVLRKVSNQQKVHISKNSTREDKDRPLIAYFYYGSCEGQ